VLALQPSVLPIRLFCAIAISWGGTHAALRVAEVPRATLGLADGSDRMLATDCCASYLGHGHRGRDAWIDALVWIEELPAVAEPRPPLLDYLERLTTA
jgi:hypothetical protein